MGKSYGGARCSELGRAQERKENGIFILFHRDSEGAFGLFGGLGVAKFEEWRCGGTRCSGPGGARNMEENFFFLGIQRQRLQEMKEKLFFEGIQRERLAAKVQPGEARFGPELDGEKLVLDQN